MGVMRFLVQPLEVLNDWPEVHRAYLSGMDQGVWPTRVELSGNEVTFRRPCSDSGKLHVAWPVKGFGRPVLTTASLPERETPYLLPVELARGKIVQVRNQVALWQSAGMVVPDEFTALHKQAHVLLARATAAQDDPPTAAAIAQQALEHECRAADLLTTSYTMQRLAARHHQYETLPTVLGCSLGDVILPTPLQNEFLRAFNGAAIPIQWRNIESEEGNYSWETFDTQVDWCLANNLLVRGGPLLNLATNGFPRWLAQWENDFWNLQSFVCDFIETAMSRYVGRIRIWEVCARGNTGGGLSLSEENRLALVAKALEVARQVDVEAQITIRIDIPWGDYQARGQHRLSPMHFADALIRAGIELSAINLEIGVGYTPSGSPSRDLLDFSRLIDQWSILGLPLQVTLAFPSAAGPDPHLTTDFEVDSRFWHSPIGETAQAEWIGRYVPLLLAKPAVIAVFWNHFSDAQPHRFPHAGLFRADGTPKPALETLVALRKEHWT